MRSNAIKTKSIRTQNKVSNFGKINKRKKENENVCLHFYNKRKNELRNFIATIFTRPHIHANPLTHDSAQGIIQNFTNGKSKTGRRFPNGKSNPNGKGKTSRAGMAKQKETSRSDSGADCLYCKLMSHPSAAPYTIHFAK